MRVPGCSGNEPGSAEDKPGSTRDIPRGTSIHCRAVWENKILFVNTAGASWNHSYYSSLDDGTNPCIQFVFSSIYLCNNIAIRQCMIYLDCMQVVIDLNWRWAWGSQTSEQRDTLGWHHLRNQVMHLEVIIVRTGRLWSREFEDALGHHNFANMEAVIKQVWRPTWNQRWCEIAVLRYAWRPWWSEPRSACQGHDWESLEMHLDAIMVQSWRL